MSEAIHLTYTTSPDLMKRASTSWARPPLRPMQQLLRWLGFVAAGAILGVLLVATGLFARMPDGFWTGGLVGFYAGLALWLFVHTRNARKLLGFSDALNARAGETQMTLSHKGVATSTQIAKGEMTWPCIDQVIELPDATVLRAGAFVYPIPDGALPEGITPQELRRRVHVWKGTAP